jgi:hypothetical protein
MDIDFDPNIKPKSYFVEIYNRATKDPKNLRKISSKLFEDLSSISNNQTSRVRQREVNDFKIQDNYGKISKTSNNSLINVNKEYAESTLNNITREDIIASYQNNFKPNKTRAFLVENK